MVDDNKNSALIILWVLIYVIAWKLYEHYYALTLTKTNAYNIKFLDIPYSIKCAFNENQCETGDIDTWTLIHAAGFFVLGYYFPNQYLTVIILSIIIVIIEPYLGYHPKYIIDPLVNLTFYSFGSIIAPKKKYDHTIYVDSNDSNLQNVNYN
jgi:hypothetical protein